MDTCVACCTADCAVCPSDICETCKATHPYLMKDSTLCSMDEPVCAADMTSIS